MDLEEQILGGVLCELQDHYGEHAFRIEKFPNLKAIYSATHDLWIFVDDANIEVVVSENYRIALGLSSQPRSQYVLFTLNMTRPDTEIKPLIDFLDNLDSTDEP
jgi:hypothetical protein